MFCFFLCCFFDIFLVLKRIDKLILPIPPVSLSFLLLLLLLFIIMLALLLPVRAVIFFCHLFLNVTSTYSSSHYDVFIMPYTISR